MAVSNDANIVCTRIHDFIQNSGLHFIINQTPWSSYITIRRKFISAVANASNSIDDKKILVDKNKTLEKKLAKLELELVAVEEDNKKSSDKIKTLEAEFITLEKDKNDVIQNLNAGFHEKVNVLTEKIETLEALNKEVLRKEKKVLKKQRQKVEKADIGSVKPLDKPNKDQNENFFDNVIETVQENSFLDVVQSQSVQGCLPHDTHASTGSSSPVRRPPTPITPMTPYTPPGPQPCSSLTPVVTTEQPKTHLSTYYE